LEGEGLEREKTISFPGARLIFLPFLPKQDFSLENIFLSDADIMSYKERLDRTQSWMTR